MWVGDESSTHGSHDTGLHNRDGNTVMLIWEEIVHRYLSTITKLEPDED
jgi:hypothetical protein